MTNNLVLYTPVLFTLILFIFVLAGYLKLKSYIEKSSEKILSHKDVNRYLDNNLIPFIEKQKPTLILAVNIGGTEIVKRIAKKRISLLSEIGILVCSVPLETKGTCEISVLKNSPVKISDISYNKIIVIDDICRSGASMVRAINCFKHEYIDSRSIQNNLYIATLASTEASIKHIKKELKIACDNYFSAIKTPHVHMDTRLPWHHSANDPYIAIAKAKDLVERAAFEQQRKNELKLPIDQLDLILKQELQQSKESIPEESKNNHQPAV